MKTLIFISILFIFNIDLVIAKPHHGPAKVVELKKFRKITYKGLTFFTSKSEKKISEVYVRKNQSLLKMSLSNSASLYEFNISQENKKYQIFIKNHKSKNYASIFPLKNYTEHNNADNSKEQKCIDNKFNKAITMLKTEELISKINSIAIEPVFNEKSCEDLNVPNEKISILKINIQNFMTPEKSLLLKCFENSKVIDNLNKNPDTISMATQILEKYYAELEALSNSKNSFKFECSSAESNSDVVGLHQSIGSESRIQFPVDKTGKFIEKKCNSTSQIIVHEFSHLAGLSEENVRKIDLLCKESTAEPLKTEICPNENSDSSNKPAGTAKVLILQEIMNQNQKINQEQQANLQPVFQESIQPSDFKPISSSDLTTISNANVESPEFSRSIENAYTVATNNMNGITAPLNAAIAASVGIAKASEPSSPRGNSKNWTSRTQNSNKNQQKINNATIADYPKSEVIADKYTISETTTSTTDNETNSELTQIEQMSQGKSITRKPDVDNLRSSAKKVNRDKQYIDSINSKQSSPGNPESNIGKNNYEQVSETITQALSVMDDINEDLSKVIRSNYNNLKFIEDIKSKGISIQYGNQIIGVSTKDAKNVFRDNGSTLRKQNDK